MKKILSILVLLVFLVPFKTHAASFSIVDVRNTDTTVKINWTPIKNATYYYAFYKVGSEKNYHSFVDSKKKKLKLKHYSVYSAELDSLPQNMKVSFKVSAIINGKEVPMKYVLTTSTLKFSIKTITTTDSLIRINWTPIKNAQYYYVYYKLGSATKYYPFVDASNKKLKLKQYSNYSAELNQIPEKTKVSFKVSAIINGKEVPMSYVLKTSTKASPVTDPTPNTGSFMSYLPYTSNGLYLYSNDGLNKYLGQLTSNQYATDSIYNQYGTYGSKYATYSIWNQYGTYGSQYSSYSVMNPYAAFPPKILDGAGNFVGYLTSNGYEYPAYNPITILRLLQNAGY